MSLSERGLTAVKTDDLKKFLKAIYHEHISSLSIEELTRVGLQHCANEILDALRTLDLKAIQVVLVAVVAERARADERIRKLSPVT